MKKFKAILFDFDGVLADTMEDNFLAWKKAFKNYVMINRQDYFLLEGMKLIKVAESISEKYNLDINPEKIVKLKNKYYLKDHLFKFYPETEKLINLLKKRNILLGVVSASPKEKLEKTVSKEFLAKFDVIVSGDDTNQGKPNPEPYLTAMNKLSLNNEDCVVIENAPLGIKSAKNAGMYCIALTTTLNKKYLKEADKILNNHKELEGFFVNEL